jgi:hypothetical protein
MHEDLFCFLNESSENQKVMSNNNVKNITVFSRRTKYDNVTTKYLQIELH